MSAIEKQVQSTEHEDFLVRLKEETRPHHDAIERTGLLSSVFRPGFNVDSYRELLLAQYLFYRPCEEMLKGYEESAAWPSWQEKSVLLRKDLQLLGVRDEQLEELEPARIDVVLEDPIAAMGMLYVFEGATLGGKVIRKQLIQTLGNDLRGATNFYSCYGKNSMQQWRSVQAALLSAASIAPGNATRIIKAAASTFKSMTHWLDNFRK